MIIIPFSDWMDDNGNGKQGRCDCSRSTGRQSYGDGYGGWQKRFSSARSTASVLTKCSQVCRASSTMQQRREWRSFQPSGCCFVALLVILLLADGVSAGNKARGIDPQDLDYFKDDTIWCKDGLKSFPRERLNDNFCDCADGTDEPGTSACPDGKYYCQNVGSAPALVYSSRVNDGICDCCDGSDEYKTRVDCTNTCGGTLKEVSESMEEDFGQSTTFDTVDVSEVVPDKQQRKFGEDLVTKLKEMKSVMLVMQWLPLFSLLSLFVWMWARVPRRLPFRQKKTSRPSLV